MPSPPLASALADPRPSRSHHHPTIFAPSSLQAQAERGRVSTSSKTFVSSSKSSSSVNRVFNSLRALT